MTTKIYSVFDSKTAIYGQPMFMLNKGAALRAWKDAANDKESNIGKHPGDYTLFEIGEWEDEAGTVQMHPAKINLGCAIEFADNNFNFKNQLVQQPEGNN